MSNPTGSWGISGAVPSVADQLAAKGEQIARLTQERDWQYEANASLIAKAGTEAYEAARAKDEQIAALRKALEGYMSGSSVLEKILWGEMDDNKTMTITVTLGVHRRARAALEMSGGVL